MSPAFKEKFLSIHVVSINVEGLSTTYVVSSGGGGDSNCTSYWVFTKIRCLQLILRLVKRYKQSNTTHQLFVKHIKTATCFGFIN
jgi:hypothetical protein